MRRALLILCLLASLGAEAATPGQPAPAFSAEALQGAGPIELAHYRGKVVLLDFWASWCPPCRQSLPAFERLRAEYGTAGFEVIAVNLDERPQDGLDFLKKYPVTYPTVRDPQGRLARLYDVRAMPMSYLIDRQGVLRQVHPGFNKKDLPRLRAAVAELLGEE
ncbi:MAG TPA: TlpA disulfide reductase family protein [Nevskiales bacterium]|nr:TlpA disulfide reductase family protein [Nevskiales bacterium]